MRHKIIVISLSIFLAFSSCKPKTDESNKGIDTYLTEVIDILKKNSIQKDEINWDSLSIKLKSKYPKIDNDSTKHSAVKWIIKENKLKHHSFMSPDEVTKWKNQSSRNIEEDEKPTLTFPSGSLLDQKIGYIKIPMFRSGDSIQLTKYAQRTQLDIKDLKDQGAKNWIVDLRGNRGGNMWPMISGLGNLIGEGKIGSFYKVNGEESGIWYYKAGKAYVKHKDSITYSVSTIPLNNDITVNKIAILQDRYTMSSGEAVLVSFLGKSKVKTFGENSGGYSTGNSNFDLSDGAILLVTTSVYADRNSNLYPNGIIPMVYVHKDSSIIDKASSWITNKATSGN